MKKLVRNMSTDESKSFWESAEKQAHQVESWPVWKRAGINVALERPEPRTPSSESISDDIPSSPNHS